jgi:SAM-dependent methyltransferase
VLPPLASKIKSDAKSMTLLKRLRIFPSSRRGEFPLFPSGEMRGDFCDRYPRFLETTETIPSHSRLNARWRAIIDWNRPVLAGRRILDLACHDGRWSFAALEVGARHVVGVEARTHLVKKARENFKHYGAPVSSYEIINADAIETLRELKAGSVDVLMCLGFFYHTLEHIRLLLEARRIGVEYIIIDTSISPGHESIVALAFETTEDTRNSIDYGHTGNKKALVGVPSRSGVSAMLDYVGYEADFFDWEKAQVEDWNDMPDYASRLRVTVRARRRR